MDEAIKATCDALIIGGGPAGLSAAIYTARAGLSTLVCAADGGALAKTEKIDNYFGFAETVSGPELLERGAAQAKRLGASFLTCEATSIKPDADGLFAVGTTEGTFLCRTLLLATGQSRKKAPLARLDEFEGRGVSYCAVCDGFFFRGKRVGVVGSSSYALAEAGELAAFTPHVTVFTNGKEPEADFSPFPVVTERLSSLEGETSLAGVRAEGGGFFELDGLFLAVGKASTVDFARKIGVGIENNAVVTDERMATAFPGLFAAGDCRGGVLQIAKAVGEGAVAALGMIETVRRKK